MISRAHRNALDEGHELHWYKIEKILGEGGFGITYLALDTNLDRHVAIKEYLPSDLATRESDSTLQPISEDRRKMYTWGLDRFHKEARTLAKFSHPNVVRVYNVFRENNTAYMVMEFEKGESLEQLIKTNELTSENDILNLVFPLLDALENVHRTKIIHRDIKPANIYIRKDGSPVLLDFGSARLAVGTQTRTLTSVVSPGFAPFEQYNPEGTKQGPWTDIYAMGATLYAVITGRGPLDAIVRGQARLEGKYVLVPASQIGKDRYSNQLLVAVDRALEFLPKDRPQSIAQWRSMFPTLSSTTSSRAAKRPEEDIPTVISEENRQLAETRVVSEEIHEQIERRSLFKGMMISLVFTLAIAAGFYALQGESWEQWHELLSWDNSDEELKRQAADKAAREQAIRLEKERALYLAEEKTQAKNKIQFDRLMNEAKAASQMNDSVLAIKMLQLALNIYPDDVIAKLSLQREQEKMQLEQEHNAQLERLLSRANELMKKNKLTSPAGENAAGYFNEALEVSPGNRTAIDGLKKIISQYVKMANKASAANNYSSASSMLSTAQNILPGDAVFDESRQLLATSQGRISSRKQQIQRDKEKLARIEHERLEKEQAKRKADQAAELEKQNNFDRLLGEATLALESEEKDLAMEKYAAALKVFPNDQRAISGLVSAKKMTYKACKQILGSWLWSVGTTLRVREDGTCTSSFMFVSLPCSWSCTDGKERKFEFRDAQTYVVTMSEDGNTLYSQGLTARRKIETKANDDESFEDSF